MNFYGVKLSKESVIEFKRRLKTARQTMQFIRERNDILKLDKQYLKEVDAGITNSAKILKKIDL